MTLLFTTTGINAAPRLGLIIAALLTLAAGLVSISGMRCAALADRILPRPELLG